MSREDKIWTVPTGYIPHSYLTPYNPVTKLDQLVWSLLEKDYCIHDDFMISYEKWHQISFERGRTQWHHTCTHYIKGDRLVYLPHLQLPSSRWASSSLALHVQQRFRFFCVDISFPRTSFFDPFSCLLVSKSRELFPWAACSVSVFLHFESFVSPWTSRLTSCSLEITFPRSCFDSFRPEVCSLGIVDGTEALFSSTFSFLCNSRNRGEMHSKKWKTAVR